MPKSIFISGTSDYFVSTRDTTKAWVSASNQISIPMVGSAYDVSRWDWTFSSWLTWTQTHTYPAPWIYTVKIRINWAWSILFSNVWDKLKILSIDNRWVQWSTFSGAFQWCENLQLNATDIPQWSFTDMNNMFSYCTAFTGNSSMNNWDVSNVTNFNSTFLLCQAFNQPLSNWDMSSATSTAGMFRQSWFNQNISWWDVSSVTNMSQMFYISPVFNQPIWSWDVSSVTNMSQMFWFSVFNQDIWLWNVGNCTNMNQMFYASPFNQNISWWDVSSVTDMTQMFGFTPFNQNISSWDVSNVTNMSQLFIGSPFNQNISWWDVSSVTNMSQMFYASSFNQDISWWDVSNVTNMTQMFWFTVLSKANYDSLLIWWSALTLQNWVTLDVSQNYSFWAAQAARASIITNYSWTINDNWPI